MAVLTQAESKSFLNFCLALWSLLGPFLSTIIADFCLRSIKTMWPDFPEYMFFNSLAFIHQRFLISSRNIGWLEWVNAQQNVLSITFSPYNSDVCCLSSLKDGSGIECGQSLIHILTNLWQAMLFCDVEK